MQNKIPALTANRTEILMNNITQIHTLVRCTRRSKTIDSAHCVYSGDESGGTFSQPVATTTDRWFRDSEGSEGRIRLGAAENL